MDVQKVLQAVLEEFAERGYDGVSLRELSVRLGLSHAALGMRFGSKKALWFAAMEQAFLPIVQVVGRADAEGISDLEVLRQGIVKHLVLAGQNPYVQRVMSHEGAVDSPRLRFIYERFTAPTQEITERLLARLVEAGTIAPIPYAAFHFLVTHGGGAMFSSAADAALLGTPDVRDPDIIRAHAETVADVIVGGLASRAASARTPAMPKEAT
jgi:TetR/AcrR family transcriptional regulator